MQNDYRILALVSIFLAGAPMHAASAQINTGDIAKQVHLVVDGDRLFASNIRTSNFDELRLNPRERLLDKREGEGVIVVVTNQRLIAYGVVSGWRDIDRQANERIEAISAADYAGLIVTNKRMLNFNGESGVWGERQRRAGQ